MVVGLIMAFYFPHRKLWARLRLEPEGTRIILVGAGRGMAGEVRRVGWRVQSSLRVQPVDLATDGRQDREEHRASADMAMAGPAERRTHGS